MRRVLSCLLCAVMTLLAVGIIDVKAAPASDKTIKKVVSIVYDDSGSMNNKNGDWEYASYSLQNLIALLNANDELGVVKMSAPTQTINYDLTTNQNRANEIKSVEKWKPIGKNTPFSAVETAINWLKAKKSNYADSQSVEYWLLVITDGSFQGYPANMKVYLNDLKASMGSSKYEGIFLAIGNNVPQYVKNDWNNVTGHHVISAANSNAIVNAMAEVSGMIFGQGRGSAAVTISSVNSGKGISFSSSFPLKKFIIYQQNQAVNIESIQAKGVKVETVGDFSAVKPGQGTITSRTIHCETTDGSFMPAGQITVNFASNINTANSNFKIVTVSAVEVNFKVLDKAGKEISDLKKSNLVEGDIVEFAATVTSSIDKKEISLVNWADQLQGQLVVNNQYIDMQYDVNDNTFYGSFRLEGGSNLAYAIVTLPGYFRAKSDVVNIYPIEKIDDVNSRISESTIEVPYKYCKEYEEVGIFSYTVSGGRINGICEFEFKNMPKGIQASVNGIFTDKNGKVSVKIRNDVPAEIKFYRNKDYKETTTSTIPINVTSDQYIFQWKKDSITEVVIKPVKRTLKLEAFKKDSAKMIPLSQVDGSDIYYLTVSDQGEYLSKEELKTLELAWDKIRGIDLKTKVVEFNGKYALEISCEKTLPQVLMKTKDISTDVFVTTRYHEQSDKASIDFYVKDSVMKYFLPLLVLIVLLFVIGHLPGIKKRLSSKKYYVLANRESEAIYVKLSSRLLPYVPEKGYGSDLTLVASSRKSEVKVANDFFEDQVVTIEGEKPEVKGKFFVLHQDEQLVVSDKNRTTTYVYSNAKTEDGFGDDFGGMDGFSDLDDTFDIGSGSDSSSTFSDNEFF